MQKFTEKLHEDLLTKLAALNETIHSEKFVVQRRMEMIIKAINQILEKLENHQFETEREEIHFFKYILPPVISLVVYYTAKDEWEAVERMGTKRARHEFMEQQLRKINDFFKDNDEFFKYYRSTRTNLDSYYFLPKKKLGQENADLLSSLMDPSFCTVYSLKVAVFLGYARLEKDMLSAIHHKEENNSFQSVVMEETQLASSCDKLVWTFPKIALIEMIYAFKAAGTFNHGKADLKKIAQYFERVFSIDLGNYSRTYQEMITRKTGFTVFLDLLKEKMHTAMDRIIGKN